MLRIVPSKSELRARMMRVAFAWWVRRWSAWTGAAVTVWLVWVEDGGGIGGDEGVRNWDVRLENDVMRLYSSCVRDKIECRMICAFI
jgi:hypothetical protein